MGAPGILLTADEREMLEQQRDLARKNGDVDLHLKMSALLSVNDGIVQRQVSQVLGVPLRTLEWWIEQYRTHGLSGVIKGPYPGKAPRLSPAQLEELSQIVKEGPEEGGFDTGMWSASLLRSLIKKLFGVNYSISHVQRLLHKLGFSVQKPSQRSSKADEDRRKDWIENELPEIQEKVEAERAVLIHGDEASFQQSGSVTQTWALRGKGWEVLTFPTRKSVKAFGAVRLGDTPKWHFRFAEKFNGESFIQFLEQVVGQYSERKVHFITDNASYHKSPPVKKWLSDHQERIEIHYLPPYSPDFNAVEYVWRKTKRMTTHNRFFRTLKELREKLFRRFNRFQGNPAAIRSTVAAFA